MTNYESPAMQDIQITFDAIDKMEDKQKSFEAEATAVKDATTKEWDRLFQSLMELQKRHQLSDCMWASGMGDIFRALKSWQDKNEPVGELYNNSRGDERKAGQS